MSMMRKGSLAGTKQSSEFKQKTTMNKKTQARSREESLEDSPRRSNADLTQEIHVKKKKRIEIAKRSVFDAYLDMKKENFTNISLPEFELPSEKRARGNMANSNFKEISHNIKHKLSLKERVALKHKMAQIGDDK